MHRLQIKVLQRLRGKRVRGRVDDVIQQHLLLLRRIVQKLHEVGFESPIVAQIAFEARDLCFARRI